MSRSLNWMSCPSRQKQHNGVSIGTGDSADVVHHRDRRSSSSSGYTRIRAEGAHRRPGRERTQPPLSCGRRSVGPTMNGCLLATGPGTFLLTPPLSPFFVCVTPGGCTVDVCVLERDVHSPICRHTIHTGLYERVYARRDLFECFHVPISSWLVHMTMTLVTENHPYQDRLVWQRNTTLFGRPFPPGIYQVVQVIDGQGKRLPSFVRSRE